MRTVRPLFAGNREARLVGRRLCDAGRRPTPGTGLGFNFPGNRLPSVLADGEHDRDQDGSRTHDETLGGETDGRTV
jgi:hypothetical protein